MIHFKKYYPACLILIFFLCFQSCSYTVYLSRHAEKVITDNPNPPLSEVGVKRAEQLALFLKDKQIKLIYSTDTERTKKTAEPIAQNSKRTIFLYDSKKPDLLLSEIKGTRKNTLIIGHSNTLKYLVNNLSGKNTLEQDLGDFEYDKLFAITRSAFKKTKAKIYIL